MAQLLFVFLSERTERVMSDSNDHQSKLNALGLITMLRPKFIPSHLSFAVNVGIGDFSSAIPHTVQVRLLTPDEQVVSDSGVISVSSVNKTMDIPENDVSLILSWGFQNIVLESEGRYPLEILFNNTLLHKLLISVRQAL